MKIWITKYALTQGVRVCEGEIKSVDGHEYAKVEWPRGTIDGTIILSVMLFHGKDYHMSAEAALEQYKRMLANKVKSLNKQLDALLKLNTSTLPEWKDK